jgi:hypothetical protein
MSVAKRQLRIPPVSEDKPQTPRSGEAQETYLRSREFSRDATAHFRRATKKAIATPALDKATKTKAR